MSGRRVTACVVVACVAGAGEPALAGDRDRPVSWSGVLVVRDGRVVKLGYTTSPALRAERAVVRARRGRVTITLHESRPPEGIGIPDGAVERCVRIRLRAPLGRRVLVDGRSGRTRTRRDAALRGRRCGRVRVQYR
jgi:hypothetical protein